MINWEELKHIHVIKKLDGILSSWFNTAILISDAHGTILNQQKGDKPSCNNSIGAADPAVGGRLQGFHRRAIPLAFAPNSGPARKLGRWWMARSPIPKRSSRR